MKPETPKLDRVRTRLNELVAKTSGLNYGYIGNFEKWGDDRMLIIWIDDLRENGRTPELWSCEARSATVEDFWRAISKVQAFALGRKSAQHPTETCRRERAK